MAWTEAQQKVIDTRNKNLLVSAAAGSGKTAVLVERIICMISEGENPLDIDHLLVVTFTNAAATEMRERIGKALEAKLIAEPENCHLQKQLSLLQSAQITTIHSFCLNILRNYFHRIDLDPSFKIAEESEITLMKSDVIADILERWYEEGREDFHAFVESYSYSKSDLPIEELILQLYNFSMSDPWPKAWIARMREKFDIASVREMCETAWMKELVVYIDAVIGDLLKKNKKALDICREANGPSAYEPALLSDRSTLVELKHADSYEEYAKIFSEISFERLSSKREEGVLPELKEHVKGLREEIKKGLKDLCEQYFFQTPEEMLADHLAAGKILQVLFDLVLDFMDEFAGKKEEKNLIDFGDLEHFALKILIDEQATREQGKIVPTESARELSEQFEEILIDEYQDSNMVQETILSSISREDMGSPNRFMVGDVKQSIYKFRLAMPEIFMEKYNTYSCEAEDKDGAVNYYQRIDLDRNFRSRQSVLDYVNSIFEQLMQKSVGGIIYDEAAALKYGGLYDQIQGPEETVDTARIPQDVELLLTTEASATEEKDEEKSQESTAEALEETVDEQEEAVYTKKELEARAIASRIKELTDPDSGMLVFDQRDKRYRPAAYRDIVILLRSMTGWSEVFVNTLMQEGIPAYADTGTGYFQTLEIMTVLNMLRIIDNPRQDIPLAGVLYSPMVGMTTTELALIRATNRNTGLYTALLGFVEAEDKSMTEGDNKEGALAGREGCEETDSAYEALLQKAGNFLEQLKDIRSMVNHVPIHELIQIVLERTGYCHYVSAMPGGEKRKANLDMLLSQAVRFEKSSYSGLFHFIRYIEKLHKYEVDFGEASTSGEQEDTVRIMSIHKSKGLEFPIVFVGGMSKQFNTQDLRSSIVLHSQLGVGPEYINSEQRTKVPTLLKKVIQKKVQTESLGEELRVLYVAMTRAREKLILSVYLKSTEEMKRKEFSFFELLSARSYLDWVLPAMLNRIEESHSRSLDASCVAAKGMMITVRNKDELLKQEVTKQLFLYKDKEELLAIDPKKIYDNKLKEEIKTRFNYVYPHQYSTRIKVKMTVSELKKLGQNQDEELSQKLYQSKPSEKKVTLPSFLRETEEVTTGTDRGTLYHRVLELIDLTRVYSREDLQKELSRLVSCHRLNEEDVKKLKQDYIYNFVSSKVAERMRKAQIAGVLHKEQQFVMGVNASEVMKETDSDELILIQGIIDVYFEEEDGLVLLDYKSDLVSEEEELIRRYRVQLNYYKRALEQMLNRRVKEMLIYSLPLAKEIPLTDSE